MLTGWAGARRGESLLRDDEQTRVERCLTALSKTLSFPRRRLDELLEAWWTHDWESDPFSRGAYTYPRVGGMAAQRALARPVEGTLFFAGEATDPDQTATVAGAIASGRRAANQLLRRSRD
jgi:monoamine oxidase